jgi:thiol-disulfide isomerase/thioredoxin
MENLQLSEWHIEGLDGAKVPTLTSFAPQPLLILFYHTGCPGCKARALPYANTVHWEYPQLRVVGLHTRPEGPAYSDTQIEEVIKVYGLKFPIYKDKGKETFESWGAEGTPHWFLLDGNGHLYRSLFGSTPNALMRLDLALTELGLEKVDID